MFKLLWSPSLDFDSILSIQHPAGECMRLREAIYNWAEADALHHATHAN